MNNKRLDNCLRDYKKIDYKVRDRYDLRVDDLKAIIKTFDPTSQNFIWDIVSLSFKMGFVLGRRSISNQKNLRGI